MLNDECGMLNEEPGCRWPPLRRVRPFGIPHSSFSISYTSGGGPHVQRRGQAGQARADFAPGGPEDDRLAEVDGRDRVLEVVRHHPRDLQAQRPLDLVRLDVATLL